MPAWLFVVFASKLPHFQCPLSLFLLTYPLFLNVYCSLPSFSFYFNVSDMESDHAAARSVSSDDSAEVNWLWRCQCFMPSPCSQVWLWKRFWSCCQWYSLGDMWVQGEISNVQRYSFWPGELFSCRSIQVWGISVLVSLVQLLSLWQQ